MDDDRLLFDEIAILDEDGSDVLHDVEGLVEVEYSGAVEMLIIVAGQDSHTFEGLAGDQVQGLAELPLQISLDVDSQVPPVYPDHLFTLITQIQELHDSVGTRVCFVAFCRLDYF